MNDLTSTQGCKNTETYEQWQQRTSNEQLRPTLDELNAYAYELCVVPQGVAVPIQMLQIFERQMMAAWKVRASDEPPSPPKEFEGQNFRSGVFTNCGYVGTASGYIVRDGTWWVATFRNEREANQYVTLRNTPPPSATEEWQPVIRETLEIVRDLLDGLQIDRHFLRVSIQTILDEWQPSTKSEGAAAGEKLYQALNQVYDDAEASGETKETLWTCDVCAGPPRSYEEIERCPMRNCKPVRALSEPEVQK